MPSQDLLRRKASLGSARRSGRTSAAELAADIGLTLVGFLRGGSMNVCTGEHRVAAAGG